MNEWRSQDWRWMAECSVSKVLLTLGSFYNISKWEIDNKVKQEKEVRDEDAKEIILSWISTGNLY
jgi:hypothetical protein